MQEIFKCDDSFITVLYIIHDVYSVRMEPVQLTDIFSFPYLKSKSLSPFTFRYITVPVHYSITVWFSICTLVKNPIPDFSCSIVDFNTSAPIAPHDCDNILAKSRSPCSLSALQLSWCTGAARLDSALGGPLAKRTNTIPHVPKPLHTRKTMCWPRTFQRLVLP